jgi:hypothetical protein
MNRVVDDIADKLDDAILGQWLVLACSLETPLNSQRLDVQNRSGGKLNYNSILDRFRVDYIFVGPYSTSVAEINFSSACYFTIVPQAFAWFWVRIYFVATDVVGSCNSLIHFDFLACIIPFLIQSYTYVFVIATIECFVAYIATWKGQASQVNHTQHC